MLEDFINQRLNYVDNNDQCDNEEINKLGEESNKLFEELSLINKEFARKVDFLIGEYAATYSRFFFKYGFKEGIKLQNEINDLKEESKE